MSRTQKNLKARQDAYIEQRDLALDLAFAIVEQLKSRNEPEPHYGHVGDLQSVNARLRDVLDQLAGTGEYAAEAPARLHTVFDRNGKPMKVSVPK